MQMQWMAWVFFFVVIMLTLLQNDSPGQAISYALLNTSFYAIIVYGNISWLFPRLYQRGHIVAYVFAAILFLVAVGVVRGLVTFTIYNSFFAMKREPITTKVIFSVVTGGVVIFLFSFVFRIALAYFTLKKQQDEIIAQRTHAELNLLKSQVQPHFLFNTLNNIYYEAYKEAPRTAALIERLSDIMRYFVDESPKQLVSLASEVQFIDNYIALEKIRIRYPVDISFTKNCNTGLAIPPMLLMTFVENIFKHGIDKSSPQNQIRLTLMEADGRLTFTAENTLPRQPGLTPASGFGIANLRRRLALLYGTDFELITQKNADIYCASLNIPAA